MVNIIRITKKRLGELLISEGLLTSPQVEEALVQQKKSGKLLGEILAELGYISETEIARILMLQYNIPFLKVSHYRIAPEVAGLLGMEFLRQHQLVPLDRIGDILLLAISGLVDKEVLDEVEKVTSLKVQAFVTTSSEVRLGLDQLATLKPK